MATCERAGYVRTATDRCVLVDTAKTSQQQATDSSSSHGRLIAGVVVDDVCAVSTSSQHEHLYAALEQTYELKRDHSGYVIGLQHTILPSGDATVSQRGYLARMLEHHDVDERHVRTPALISVIPQGTADADPRHVREVQAITGSLMYVQRPDIVAARRQVACIAARASAADIAHARRIMQYLQGTPNRGIRFFAAEADMLPRCYIDSGWAVPETVCSYIIFLNGGAVAFHAKKVRAASSSTDAELQGADRAITPLETIRNWCADVGHPCKEPSPMYTDSKALVDAVNNDGAHKRLAHVAKRVLRIRETQQRKICVLKLIPREQMLSDILVTPRGPTDYEPMRDVIAPVTDRDLTDQELEHRANYPHVAEARARVLQRQQNNH